METTATKIKKELAQQPGMKASPLAKTIGESLYTVKKSLEIMKLAGAVEYSEYTKRYYIPGTKQAYEPGEIEPEA